MNNKIEYQKEIFTNRLKKKYKDLRKWARKNRITCYRIYDKDIPEIPLAIDLYEFLPDECYNVVDVAKFLSLQNERISQNDKNIENEIKERTFVVIYLYERPYQKSDDDEIIWLNLMAECVGKVLGITENHIIQKMRKHQKGMNQYEKTITEKNIVGRIQEQGQIFKIDLTKYLDTGLFFDHRPLRSKIREISSKKSVLNLFSYTGSFSVYSAAGNASQVESVDLSNTYLSWAEENMRLNGFSDKTKYKFTKADCIRFLQEKAISVKQNEIATEDLYDIIILDPPTFSNSKNTQNILDINKQWQQLVKDCLNILKPKGKLYFSTNSERLKFDISLIPQKTFNGKPFVCNEITEQTIPYDFSGTKSHRCWEFVLCE